MESKNIIKRTQVAARTINPEQRPKNTDAVEECFFSVEKKHFILKETHICLIVSVYKLMNVPYASWPACVVGIKEELRRFLCLQALNSPVTPLVIVSLPTYSCS